MTDDPRDFSDQYNTALSPDDERSFQLWVNDQSQKTGRNIANDSYDYDLRGWWKQNGSQPLSDDHLVDTFKKPNHPTFSDQSQYHGVGGNYGGTWNTNADGSYSFVPGRTNLTMFHPDELRDYFGRVERGNNLILPQQAPQPADPRVMQLLRQGVISQPAARSVGIIGQ